MAEANFGGSPVLPWVEEKLEELGATGDDAPVLFDETDGIDFEAVSDTDPDVIFAGYSGIDAEDYETLSKIAPTVPFPKDQVAWGTTWREHRDRFGPRSASRTRARTLSPTSRSRSTQRRTTPLRSRTRRPCS